MSLDDYPAAARLVSEHSDLADFVGERPEELVERAEAALSLRFPPSYRSFLRELGAGDIAGEEFYGLVTDDFENSSVPDGIWLTLDEREASNLPEALVVVYSDGMGNYYCLDTAHQGADGEHPVVMWMPGASEPDDELEVMSEDFGRFFYAMVSEGLARDGATS